LKECGVAKRQPNPLSAVPLRGVMFCFADLNLQIVSYYILWGLAYSPHS